jgi:leader peptidase (prepilin peptidase)/N-methyltransferase
MSAVLLAALVVASGVGAASCVRAVGATGASRSRWPLAAVLAGLAALAAVAAAAADDTLGSGAGAWTGVAVAVAASGLVAAAAIDAGELRIPARLAWGTAAVSFVSLAIDAWRSSAWTGLGTAVAGTAAVVAVFSVLWMAGAMGFGDVRLAASTLTASLTLAGTLTFLWATFAVAGVTAVVVRRRRTLPSASPPGARVAASPRLATSLTRPPGGVRSPALPVSAALPASPVPEHGAVRPSVPFAPAVAIGWLVAVVLA